MGSDRAMVGRRARGHSAVRLGLRGRSECSGGRFNASHSEMNRPTRIAALCIQAITPVFFCRLALRSSRLARTDLARWG
jgi:hypothetical protein